MRDEAVVDDRPEVRELQAELRALRQQLQQREQLLKVLNRRLLELERGDAGASPMERVDTGMLLVERAELAGELESMRQTKLFRWSSPARDVYARLRGTR